MVTIVDADADSVTLNLNGLTVKHQDGLTTPLSNMGPSWMEDLWGFITRPWQQPDMTNPEELRAAASRADRRAATYESMADGTEAGTAGHPVQEPGERSVRALIVVYRSNAQGLRDQADEYRRRADDLQ